MAKTRYQETDRDQVQANRDKLAALTKQCDFLLKEWDRLGVDAIMGPQAEAEKALLTLTKWANRTHEKLGEWEREAKRQAS